MGTARFGARFLPAMKTFGAMSLFLALAFLSACDSYPRDIEGTRDRVVESKRLRVGYGPMRAGERALAARFATRLAAATGAQLAPAQEGADEALFAALETDDLDLVMTEVAKDSPWLTELAVVEPLASRKLGARELGLSPVTRNGENRWVMLLEAQVRAMRDPS